MFRYYNEFNDRALAAHQNSVNKGFWSEGQERNKGEMVALFHSEISELFDAYMKYLFGISIPSDHIPPFDLLEEECADIFIRVWDMCAGFKWEIVTEVDRISGYKSSKEESFSIGMHDRMHHIFHSDAFDKIVGFSNVQMLDEIAYDDILRYAYGYGLINHMHLSASNVLENIRKNKNNSRTEYNAIIYEMSLLLIKVMGFAYFVDAALPTAINTKMKFNANRPHKHNKQF